MSDALIGYTGFVGANLARQMTFGAFYNSRNFGDMAGREFRRVVCSGLPAAKWIANREPQADRANIAALEAVLSQVEAQEFILVSTIDVYPTLHGADEDYDCHSVANHAYGRHRLEFEDFVRTRFPGALVIRLPALFGDGLKKNVIYDLLHDNCLETINPASRFQWYPLDWLGEHIRLAQQNRLELVNLFTEPFATADLLRRFFPGKTVGEKAGPAVSYDLRSRYAELFGGQDGYVAAASQVLTALDHYLARARKA